MEQLSSVVSALDIHTGISESTERAAEIKTHKEKESERDRECIATKIFVSGSNITSM